MAKPLEGVRVLDFSQFLAGPFGTRVLGDLGAEVIKIEQPGVGDPSRTFPPHFLGGESAYFLGMNRSKQGMTLNLRHPEARRLFYELVRLSDVVFDNFRPSVLPRLGLDYESLKKVNPTIISCSLSGYGQDGPYRERPGFDGLVQALGGAMSVTGEAGRPPVFMGFPIGDAVGGWVAIMGILAALYARLATGQAQRVDVSLLDVQIALQAHLGQFYLVSGDVPQPIGSGHPGNVPIGAYKTKEGKYLQLHCPTNDFFQKLAGLLAAQVPGLEALPQDPRFSTPAGRLAHRKELEEVLRKAFLTRPRDEWMRLIVEADVPGAPVNDIGEALADPQVLFRNMVVEMDHPKAGRYKTAGNPIKMDSDGPFGPPPTLGQHTDDILQALLGLSAKDIDTFREAGAI